jgi:hypothetical protein
VNEGWDYPRFNPNIPSFQRCFHLVGGLEYVLFSISYMGCHPIDELIFFKMVKITNQSWFMFQKNSALRKIHHSTGALPGGFVFHLADRILEPPSRRWECHFVMDWKQKTTS